jgi:hypothetical protein
MFNAFVTICIARIAKRKGFIPKDSQKNNDALTTVTNITCFSNILVLISIIFDLLCKIT